MAETPQLAKLEDVFDALEIAAKTFGMKRLAPEVDKSYSALANELSRQPTYKLGLSTAILIMAKTGDMRPLEEINAIFNRVTVPVPGRPWGSPENLVKGLSAMALEFAQATESFARAISDGFITDGERGACIREIGELVEACLRVKTWLEMGRE
ncbi:MAG: hypothetical protein HZB23_03445 [Deltaproteobacteria bacterium]|nr:hypothetical protein [Deltaproteobacteria bacterium]